MAVIETETEPARPAPVEHDPPPLNPLGERIRLTELRRRGALADVDHRRLVTEIDAPD